MITSSDILQRTGDLVSAPMGEELAMMDMQSGTYYVLDEVAAYIWERLAAPTPVGELLATLQSRYAVSAAQCEADVVNFLQRLHAKGLVRTVE